MFRGDNAIASVERFAYVNGKASSRTMVGSHEGYLTEVGISELASPEMYGRVYHFNTAYGADIEQSDKITIGTTTYSVQNVFHKKACVLSFTRAIIIKDA